MADHRVVDVNGIRLAYRAHGPAGAPPLVLLHALGEDSTDWDGVIDAFTARCGVVDALRATRCDAYMSHHAGIAGARACGEGGGQQKPKTATGQPGEEPQEFLNSP